MALQLRNRPQYQFGMRHSDKLASCEVCHTSVCAMALDELIASPHNKIFTMDQQRRDKVTQKLLTTMV